MDEANILSKQINLNHVYKSHWHKIHLDILPTVYIGVHFLNEWQIMQQQIR